MADRAGREDADLARLRKARMGAYETIRSASNPPGEAMHRYRSRCARWSSLLFSWHIASALAQGPVIVPEEELPRVVPTGFYYEGQVAPTQMRNATALRISEKKHVIAALVD